MATPYLAELIGQTVALKRRGRAFWGLCPFHAEKTPSFEVYEARHKWRWHCQGCHEKGDAIDWLMRTRGLTYPQARASLNLPIQTSEQRSASERTVTQRLREQVALAKYRDTHPHCTLPDEAIDTRDITVSAKEIAALRNSPVDRKFTDVELLDIQTVLWRDTARLIRAETPKRSRYSDWLARYDCPLHGWAIGLIKERRP